MRSVARPRGRRLLRILLPLLPLAAACGGESPTDPPGLGRSSVAAVAGAGVTDTVLAAPLQALVVEVRNERGAPALGAVVRFEPVPPADPERAHERGMYVCPLAAARCGPDEYYSSGLFATDTADANGRAKAIVRFGTVAGPATVKVTVPEFGLSEEVAYTVQPGAAQRIVFVTEDTALLVGHSFSPGASAGDRFGNARSDAVTLTAASAHVTVSGSGGVTAVSVGRAVLVARAGAYVDTAYVSVVPGGTVAAFGSTGDGAPGGIYTMSLDGSGLTRVTSASGDNDGAAPSWSPDGSRIAFHDGGYDQAELYTVNMAGDRVRLAPTAPAKMAMWGKFSPDGQWVYYHGQPTNGQPYRLYRARSDGSAIELVSSDTATDFEWRGSPSPDGTRVVYTRGVYWGSTMLYVLDLATGVSTPLGVGGQSARWSPDGSLIAFVESSDGGTLSVIRPDGAGVRRVSPPDRWYAVGFDWSPDGKWIIARGSAVLELIDVNAGSALPLPFGARFVQPSWKPSSE